MGETRARKSKKACKKTADVPLVALDKKLDSLNIDGAQVLSPTSTRLTAGHISSGVLPSHDNDLNADAGATDSDGDYFRADPDMIEVQSTEHKGVAIFAARRIPAGTLLLTERPLIRLTQAQEDEEGAEQTGTDRVVVTATTTSHSEGDGTNNTAIPADALDKQFQRLSKPDQKAYLALFDSKKASFSRIKSIYYSNCYNLSGSSRPCKSSPGGSCVGLLASRINHSCVPNSQFSFDETRGLMLFFAIKAIPKGREVTSNYDSVFETTATRKRRQMLYYGFTCDCEACTGGGRGSLEGSTWSEFWAKSDARRRAMIETRKIVRDCEKNFDAEHVDNSNNSINKSIAREAMAALEKLEGLLVKEGIVGLPLADACRNLAKWTSRAGDSGNSRPDNITKKQMLKELDVSITCLGARSERVRDLKARIGRLD